MKNQTAKENLINKFDDLVTDETGVWSQVCNKHIITLKIDRKIISETACDELICGVENCENEASYYIDLKESNQ